MVATRRQVSRRKPRISTSTNTNRKSRVIAPGLCRVRKVHARTSCDACSVRARPNKLGTALAVTAVAPANASAMLVRLKVPQKRGRLETGGMERVNPASE